MSGIKTIWRGRGLIASAVALLGVAAVAGSQVPTNPRQDTTAKKASTQRIKIQKEPIVSGGEVVRVETLTVNVPVIDKLRDDSIRATQAALDSATSELEKSQLRARLMNEMRDRENAIRAEEAARKEAEAAALRRHLARGWYFGIGGGTNAPQRAIRDGYTGGYNVTIPVGYDVNDTPLGFRFDGSVDHLNGTRLYNQSMQTIAMSGDITVWSVNADMKLRMAVPRGGTRTHVYALGGVGAHRVTGGVYGTTGSLTGTNLAFNDASTKFGWNAGAGASLDWGPAELFLESRFFQVKTDLPYHTFGGIGTYTSFTPFVIGLTWY